MISGSTMDWELTNSPFNGNAVRTLVLFGRTGNGKSATGNTILGGKKAFMSKKSSSAVTRNCELQGTILRDGKIINVIDTPGLFDHTGGSDSVCREIASCISMAMDGIHAVLAVFSVRTRFSEEEVAAVRSLQAIFGSRILDYIIVVFTGGDEFEDNNKTFEDYLGSAGCPEPLEEIIVLCKNRVVLFDNKTKDESKRVEQVEKLLSLVNLVVEHNGGRPYTDEVFAEWKELEIKLRSEQERFDSKKDHSSQQVLEFKDQKERSYEEQLKRITEMIESKLRGKTITLEQQLEEEKAARMKIEKLDCLNEEKSNELIRQLEVKLVKAEWGLRNRGNIIVGVPFYEKHGAWKLEDDVGHIYI